MKRLQTVTSLHCKQSQTYIHTQMDIVKKLWYWVHKYGLCSPMTGKTLGHMEFRGCILNQMLNCALNEEQLKYFSLENYIIYFDKL